MPVTRNHPKPKATLSELYGILDTINQEIAALEAEKETIRTQLAARIPANSSLEGIKHQVRSRTTVKHKDYATYLIDKFVAPNRRHTATQAVDAFTTTTEAHYYMKEETVID